MDEKGLPTGDKSLIANGAWWRLLFERANDAILIENKDSEILDANERACQLLGYSREELLRMKAPDLQAPKARGQAGQAFESIYFHRDGARIPVEISATRITGGIVFSIVRDITHRKQLEEALRESEERYRRLVESVTDYGYTVEVINGHSGVTTHGQGCVAVTGYTPEEYANEAFLWHRMVHDDDKQAVIEQAAQILAGQGAFPLEHRIIHKDGSIRWVRNTPVPRYSVDGRLLAYYGLITDITKRKLAETALRESEEKYRAVVKAAMDAIFLGTLDGRILDCNTAACKMYGYAKDELLKLTVAQLAPAEIAATLPKLIIEELAHGGFFSEAVNQRKDGTVFSCEVSTRLITVGGEPRIITYVHDITDRLSARLTAGQAEQAGKQAEAALRQAHSDLELRVEERTAELANAIGQLRREIEERQRAEEALERRATQLAIINDIGRRIAAALDLGEVLNRTTRLFQERFDYHHVGIFVVEAKHGDVILKAAAGSYNISFPKEHRLRLGEGMVGWTAAHGEKRLSNNVSTDPYYVPSFAVTHSELCVPICMAGKTIGVLDTQSPHLNGFDKSDVLVMETLADQVAVAMENARLFEQAQRELAERRQAEAALRQRNEELMAYNAIAATISQSLDLEHVLRATLDTILEVISIKAGWIQLLDETNGETKLAVQRGFSPEMVQTADFVRLGERIMRQSPQPSQPGMAANVATDPRLTLEPESASLQGLAAVPIKSKDNVLGVLGVVNHSGRQLGPRRMQLLTTVGNQLGVAIENVRLARQAAEIELLRELDRLRSELLANISHELRTPLGLIKVFCTTLLRQDADFDAATQREFLGDIREETDKLEELVDNLLDLSRMQRGQLRLDARPTDLSQLARKVMKALEIQMAQPDGHAVTHSGCPHYLVHDFPPASLVALVDSRLVEQVLRNLLSNAIKYSPEGGRITVRGRADKDDLIIEVSDQGVGISASDMEHVFERFYRVDNELTQSVRGAGLGLPVCKGIVEAHGGRMWVESEPGVGSTFYFSLPRGQVSQSGEELAPR